jgi:hypothetical protein
MFSELGDLLEPCRQGMSARLLAAIQCVRRWRRAGFGNNEVAEKSPITDREIELVFGISTWDDDVSPTRVFTEYTVNVVLT